MVTEVTSWTNALLGRHVHDPNRAMIEARLERWGRVWKENGSCAKKEHRRACTVKDENILGNGQLVQNAVHQKSRINKQLLQAEPYIGVSNKEVEGSVAKDGYEYEKVEMVPPVQLSR